MKIHHIGKIASVALGLATLSACTTYTGYSSAGYSTGYNSGYYNNGYVDYAPPLAPALIAPPVTVVQPSVVEVVRQPAPIIVEENRRRGFFSRYDDRRSDTRYRQDYRQDYRHYQGERRDNGVRREGYRQNRPNGVGVNGQTPQTTNQTATQNRGDWRNRGRYQQSNGVNSQPQRPQRPTYQRPQRYKAPSTTTQATPAT